MKEKGNCRLWLSVCLVVLTATYSIEYLRTWGKWARQPAFP
ncbi:MAG: hypothetical protein ABIL62_17235 [Planctomycetota bacterium]